MAKTELKAAAPTAVAVPDRKGTAVTTASVGTELLRQHGEAHTQEFGREDLVLPFLRVAQSNSPEIDENDAKYIEGLRVGDFFNTATRQVYAGKTGIRVVVVSYVRSHMEFKLRENGGGPVKEHGPDNAIENTTRRDDKNRSILPNGNQLVTAGMYSILQITEEGTVPAVLALASTQLKKARRWNAFIKDLRVSDARGSFKPAVYYMSYRITTVQEQNENGKWYGVVIAPEKPTLELENGEQIYLAASQLRELVDKGAVTVQQAEPGTDPAEDDDVPF